MPRLKNGMARVEFLAVRAEAEVLVAQGHPCASIYEQFKAEQFKAEGKISMSYAAFHRHLKPRKTKDGRGKAAARTPPAGTAPPRVSANGAQAFDGKNAVPLSDLLTGE